MSLELLASVFGIIFVAELPDKTALASLVLATRHRALPVFLGAAFALSVQSVIAVGAGSLLGELDARWVRIGSGVLFLACAAVMLLRQADRGELDDTRPQGGFWKSLATTFVVIFIAEWGDLTQIGTAALQARYRSWPTVMLGSVAALWAVTAIAVTIGNRAGKLLDPKVTRIVAAIVFAAVGAVLLARELL
ncbi:MAG TPA: TMEM165/GDT1 family protein [Kofleriaceae bacterium]|nr:TMEM165/GDT1 family protein [Kofleriaceae bacterium]